MRRFKQLLPEDKAKEILTNGTNGILSLTDADGTPYGVPLNYVYDGDKTIYFHSAVEGRKIDCIRRAPHCSFCVVGQDRIIPEEFTSYFRSVIIEGNICIVSDKQEMMKGLSLLCEKYAPGIDATAEMAKSFGHVAMLRLDIESLTGKEAIELTRQRKS